MPDLLNHLEVYISAQKGVGFNAFIFSAGMVTVAILLYIYGTSQLAAGLRNGTFLSGNVIMEAFSYLSIAAYFQYLTN